MMVALEGPDMCGKTQIASALVTRMGFRYFKNSGEWKTPITSPEYFKTLLVYGGSFLTDFLCQVRPNVILDRYYPSEWVYSCVFKRDTDHETLEKIDRKFSEAGGKIVVCRRKSYQGIKDDLHEQVDSKKLEQIDAGYADFLEWTKCKSMCLWVDDEDLEREILEIRSFLEG